MGFWIFILFVIITIGYFRFQKIENQLSRLDKEFSSLHDLFMELKESVTIHKTKPSSVEEEIKIQETIATASKETVKVPPATELPPAVEIPPMPEMPPPSPLPPKPYIPSYAPLKSSDDLRPTVSSTYTEEEESRQNLNQEIHRPSSIELKWQEFKANVDWEQFTGGKLFAWLGGLALFIAAIFFVKYSIDNNLIPPQVRLAIGALVGLIMIIGSMIIDRERYKTTAHSLAAGGIAVLYAISFAASVYYGFIPKIAGFGLFSLISAAAFVLAVFLKGRFISVLGAIGAYATPLLIQTGHPNLIGLFIFLSVVNLGLFEVIRRTDWLPLYVLVTAGTLFTLSAGAWGTRPPAENYLICIIALANLSLFSVFFWLYRGRDPANRSVVISLRLLFLSILAVALIMINETGCLPLVVVCIATLIAMILSYKEKSWSVGFILYAFVGFILVLFWAVWKLDFREPSWSMIVLFAYLLIAGLGPVFVIRKNGVDPHSLQWLKFFPATLVAVATIVFFKTQGTTFLFWPFLLSLNVIGIFISLIVGNLFSIALLALMLLVAGVGWVLRTPSIYIGNEFFLVILFAGLLLCFVTILFLKKLKEWNPLAGLEEIKGFLTPEFTNSSAWISALPVLGPFLLLALVLFRQQPVSPNPAMVTGLCFFCRGNLSFAANQVAGTFSRITGCFGADRSKLGINASPR